MSRRRICKTPVVHLVLATLLSVFPAMAVGTEATDGAYRDGDIYTVDEAFSKVTALAIRDDRLVYVGGETGVGAYIGPDTKVVSLDGETVILDLVEEYTYAADLDSNLMDLDCLQMPKQAILDLVKAAVEQAKPGEWTQDRSWMNTVREGTSYPTRGELDAVAPSNPIFLTRTCEHMGWANSKATKLAGVTSDTPNPQGGEYLKNVDGKLLGCMTDTAMNPARELTPELTVERMQEGLSKTQEQLFSYGLTSAANAGNSIEVYNEVFTSLYESGELKLHVYRMISHTSTIGKTAEYLKSYSIDNENYEPLHNNHLSLYCVKVFADGSLSARSAATLEPYSDRESHIGDCRYTQEQVNEVVKVAYDADHQITTHRVGDGANDQMINAYEAAIRTNPRDDYRPRTEHLQTVTPADIDRAISLGIPPSIQTTHAISDTLVMEDRVGNGRIEGVYAWRTILDKSNMIPNGPDTPVELVNPYHGIRVAVTRTNRLDEPEDGWHIEEAMTYEEALHSFTSWSAYAEFSEDIEGSLEIDKLVDFAVIDRDLMTYSAKYVRDTQALLTVSRGEEVYHKDASAPIVMWNSLAQSFNNKLVMKPGKIQVLLNNIVNDISAEKRTEGSSVLVTPSDKSARLPVKTVDDVEHIVARALFEDLSRNVI